MLLLFLSFYYVACMRLLRAESCHKAPPFAPAASAPDSGGLNRLLPQGAGDNGADRRSAGAAKGGGVHLLPARAHAVAALCVARDRGGGRCMMLVMEPISGSMGDVHAI
jgi:hypothetical protein